MKGVKGKFMNKLKSIRPIGYLKPLDRVLQVKASDGYYHDSNNPTDSDVNIQPQSICNETEQKKITQKNVAEQEPDVIDVTELMKDLKCDESEAEDDFEDKENLRPRIKAKENSIPIPKEPSMGENRAFEGMENRRETSLSEIDISCFRRPDLNSGSLFDPNLLAAFQQAVIEYMKISEAEREEARRSEKQNLQSIVEGVELDAETSSSDDEEEDPLLGFEEKCPPGVCSETSVVFYTTTLRGIRKTFDDCNSVRFLLESFRVVFFERDVSMHMEFRQELWRLLDCKALPPKLFVKGRYIGGAEEVLTLHEQGKLKPLFQGVPIDWSNGPCEACDGARFAVCFRCSGSCKVIDEAGQSDKCSECNENGLILCPLCC